MASDAAVLVEDAWVVLSPIVVAASVPCDVPKGVVETELEDEAAGLFVVELDVTECVALMLVVSRKVIASYVVACEL